MTTEEKAKAYDKVSKEVKEFFEGKQKMYSDVNQALEYLFPELKESEDERIKNRLIKLIKMSSKVGGFALHKWEADEMLAWLEKHDKQKQTLDIPKWKYKKDSTPLLQDSIILNKYGCVAKSPSGAIVSDVWILDYNELAKLPKEKLEQESTDKVEPKFKVGDFIVNDYCIGKVIELTDDAYLLDTGQGIPFSCEHNAHLWTIQDAKDGDILFQDLMDGKTFIYNGVNSDKAILYSFIISNDGKDVLPYHIGKPNTGIGNIEENKNIIRPATKKQRDQLEKAMADAGYTFDFEKKELRKIKKQGEQKPKWTEEDEERLQSCISTLQGKGLMGGVDTINTKWLKSLKQRQVESKWIEEDSKMLGTLIAIFEVNYPDGFYKVNPIGTTDMQGIYSSEIVKWLRTIKQKMEE